MAGPTDSAELWRLTSEFSPVGMTLVEPEGTLRTVNRAFAAMLGYVPDDLIGRHFRDITHPDDLAADLEHHRRALAGEVESYRLRKRYLHVSGEAVWVDLSVALARDPDGRPAVFIAQILDLTEHQLNAARLEAANRAIERERQSLEAIFETVSVGLLLIDVDGRYLRMNRRHEETLSLPFPDGHEGVAGQVGYVYHVDGHTPMAREEMPSYRAWKGEEFDDYTYWVGRDRHGRAAFSTSARQVRGPDGERLGAALAYQEVTDLMRAMQVKDQFVASVSHELRTPLTSVLGHLELLCEVDGLPPLVARQLRVVQRNAQRLGALVADLLQVAHAGSGAMQLERDRVDLVAVVREALEAAGPDAAASGVDLTCDLPRSLVALVDPGRIRQVLDNLVSNAVKYTPAGGRATVRLREEADGLVLEVADTGEGIPADELPHVFTRFFRGAGARDAQVPGTGLGLDIVATIIDAHDGSVEIDSEVGRGTEFRVTLPLTPG